MTLGITASGTDAAPTRTQLSLFREHLEQASGRDLGDPAALHSYSVTNANEFWREFLRWSQLPWSGSDDVVLTGDDVETARFFPHLRLNYAEALLRPMPHAGDDHPALTAVHADRPTEHWTRGRLREEVALVAGVLADLGLSDGDRMVLIAPHTITTVVTALAGAAIGAAVSTAPPDMGTAALLGRFEQVGPALLVVDRAGMAEATLADVVSALPTVRRLLLLDEAPAPAVDLPVDRLSEVRSSSRPMTDWERRPFDAPLFVMFSSGTTGPPKAMVHGAGGTLLEHVKEHRLHGDLRPTDTLYFHTTTAWMMWNWQLSALAVGAHVVLYDGPVSGPETLWELVAGHGVTVFGTSPAYLDLCQDSGYRPARAVDLSRLRTVLSTGAVLHDWQFDWVAEAVGPVPLQSISGGTDIIGCFVLGWPELPVRRGRAQARSLGLDVAAVDGDGREVVGEVGELVCRHPFPSRPIAFLRDPDGSRFHESYFADHPGMWTHGDLVEFDEDGSARLHGRSDGVLNIDGVRIGPSEIYTVLRGVPQITDSMAVEQRDPTRRGSTRMVLLIVLRPGAHLDQELERTIRRTLRQQASAAHVPSRILAVPELPHTHNGKRSERAARDALNGDPVVNLSALRNPGCLDAIRTAGGAAPAPPGARARSRADLPDAGEEMLGAVARIWCDALGVDETDADADFSDLGGTSRQAVTMLRRLRVDAGVDVDIADFLRRPTLANLATLARSARGADVPGTALLRPGAGRPLFVLADAWGQVNSFRGLVGSLDVARPVHGLLPPLEDGAGRRYSVTEVATTAIALLKTIQPSGPYSLLGYSFGGLVTYEMACQLRTSGQEVAYLGLIDVFPPSASLTRREAVTRRLAGRLHRLRSWRSIAERIRERVGPADPAAAAWHASWTVFNAHRLRHYDGAVTYYEAERSLPVVRNSLDGWRRAAPHLLTTRIPGVHDDLLSQAYAPQLATRISATLH